MVHMTREGFTITWDPSILLLRWHPGVDDEPGEWGRGANADPPVEDHAVAELVDLAKAGRRGAFEELAGLVGLVGVRGKDLEELWDGTRARLRA